MFYAYLVSESSFFQNETLFLWQQSISGQLGRWHSKTYLLIHTHKIKDTCIVTWRHVWKCARTCVVFLVRKSRPFFSPHLHIIWYLYDLWYQSLKIISRLGFDPIHVFFTRCHTMAKREYRKDKKWFHTFSHFTRSKNKPFKCNLL